MSSLVGRWATQTFAYVRALALFIGRSDLFFWAGAVTFNVFVGIVPLLLFAAGIIGFLVESPSDLLDVVLSYLPAIEGDVQLSGAVRQILEGLIQERAEFSLIGGIVLLWVSTRLVGSLRTVLRLVFEVPTDRGLVRGKFFDLFVVFLGGLLLVLNVGVTFGIGVLEAFGESRFDLGGGTVTFVRSWIGWSLSVGSAWVLFFLLYWYLPARPIPFRSAGLGATFTAVGYELLKGAFAWAAMSTPVYSSIYGGMGVLVILFFWIYYSAVVFILGAQAARVHEMRNERMGNLSDGLEAGTPLGARVAPWFMLALVVALPSSLAAQPIAPFGGNGNIPGFLNGAEGVVFASSSLERELSLDRPLVHHDGPYVVVHIAESRVLVLEGTEVIWSAPAGTGHGFQLEGQGKAWTFTTPVGMFRVLRREKDPIWIAPDWYYIEQNLPIPPPAQRARVAGTLGTSALFLGDGIAIHGTNRPDLLLEEDPDDRRVSHGCIRLTNEAARQLYHLVEVGTPVLIF